ncbi:hypothetical protein STENM327S_04684 [Streptomyces tendae]
MSPVNPFDDAATARAVVDGSGTLREWNEGARLLLGHPAAEVVGRPAADLLADDRDGTPPGHDDDRWSGTLDLRHRDGHTVSVWVLAHRRPAADGAPPTWLAVTPLRSGPEPEDDPLVRAALTQSPCAMMIFDDRLLLRGVNDAMARLLGLPPDRVRGLRATDFGDRPQNAELERQMRACWPPVAGTTCRPVSRPWARAAPTRGTPGPRGGTLGSTGVRAPAAPGPCARA